ncbi:ATP-grasp domain-containing protein [Candidatus Binatia bacterium]|nr:ATP-grasp domain-containing protein [Candidatus Binatia bacterium]
MPVPFQRVAIVNRGEAAMRLIHAVRELNRELERRQAQPLRTIALYTEPEQRAMFVRKADESYCIGPAMFVDPKDGERKSAYLDYAMLERALLDTGAEAVWVGWGFVSEHADFADLCRRLDVVFIGPDGNVMRWLGDKIAAKHLAERVGVPVAPWSGGPVESHDEARLHAERIGFPLVIKATAGGGGRGIRRVESLADLDEAFERARSEALRSFGDATVFIERMVAGARHVEVQIVADNYGNVWAVGVRDCTIQRRNQKVLEEAPSPVLSAEEDRWVREAAVRLCQSAGYRNAGTVEFLFEPETRRFSFLEVNARLQVEHPVTEMTTGLDLVKLQLHVAAGGRLDGAVVDGEPTAAPLLTEIRSGEAILPNGHAIEVRLNAEDPDNQFRPAPGSVEVLRLPTGPGLRIDIGVNEGDVVPPEFDSMIAKIVAHGHNRDEALARLRRALADMVVVIRGGTTNKAFLVDLLDRAEVSGGGGDNTWLDRLAAAGAHLSRRHADVAILQAAIDAYDAELAIEQSQFYTAAARGRPRVKGDIGYTVDLRYRGRGYRFLVLRLGPRRYRVDTGGRRLDVGVDRLGRYERWLTIGEARHRVLSVPQGLDSQIEVDGVPHHVSRDDGGLVRAPSPAVVLNIPVKVGDEVETGARLVVLEAMKMEMPVTAPFAGRVRQILVKNNVQVDTGAPLVVLEPAGAERDAGAGEVLDFAALGRAVGMESAQVRCRRNLEGLVQLMLGFDVDTADARMLFATREALCRELPPDDEDLWRGENELLAAFADLCSLFRRQPASDDPEGPEAARTEEYLFSYLRSPDTRGGGLPESFLAKLRRALTHYGVDGFERTPRLDESLVRIFKAQQRIDQQSAVILNILERRLHHVETLIARTDPEFRALLDRLVAVTHGRAQTVSDAAREVRYRYFDEPLFAASRRRVYRDMEDHLAYLARRPRAHDRSDRINALVNCAQPLLSVLWRLYRGADVNLRELILEVMTRRYYRIRDIGTVICREFDHHPFAAAEYDWEGRHIHVVATYADYPHLAETAAGLTEIVRDIPPESDVVVDFYVWSTAALPEPDDTARQVQTILAAVAWPRRLRRVVVVITGPGEGEADGPVQHFTFRPSADGYAEELLHRGLHPMMAKRMHMWRLANFDTQRLPASPEVYLFHAVAHSNPKDERLIAIAEVRDLTPVRDDSGRVVNLPYLERMLMEALSSIRRVQAERTSHNRFVWNRILLYVWPPLDLHADELNEVMHKLAPATEGLGIEQVVVRARMPQPETGELRDTVLRMSNPTGSGLLLTSGPPPDRPLEPLSEYDLKVLRMRQRGLVYPYEIVRMLTPTRDAAQAEFPPGDFVEYDLDAGNRLVPVERPAGNNAANIVVGVVRNYTRKYKEGMARVILLGDPSRAMGALAEPECLRISRALDLAAEMKVPVEWFALSAGAKISMESGTENMDWISHVLRKLIEFTQAGGEVNVVVNGINVGAQPYWNAEATMLMHTRGILVMTPLGAMVLTGKQALDYSGSVSAEDNQGIGGYERIMGPNGQAQYWARDIAEAIRVLFQHYDLSYLLPGEAFPRRAATTDPIDRDVRSYPHGTDGGEGFALVGDVFSNERNPGRKRPFEIRRVMAAAIDQDHRPLERWHDMRDAEIGVVWDAHLGGYPVCMIGIESHSIPRLGFLPADGPDHWTAGTLFPKSSKKIARAINATSGNRPLVVLANLSGFDGSPESMREVQLEYGAEIGRAIVNFRGPIVFCVVSRYHGGAYVVFSGKLNANIEAAAVEGSYASVIGGAPAAAVVFAGEVAARVRKDPRVQALEKEVGAAEGVDKVRLRGQLDEVMRSVHSEKLGEVADEFDKIHSVQRALKTGALHHIIPAARLRPYLIEALERGMQRYLAAGREPVRQPWGDV